MVCSVWDFMMIAPQFFQRFDYPGSLVLGDDPVFEGDLSSQIGEHLARR